jgi:hypothetical protein
MRRRAVSTLDKQKWSSSHTNQFIPGECAPAPTELMSGWVPDSVWTPWRTYNVLPLPQIERLRDRPSRNLVTIPTELHRLQTRSLCFRMLPVACNDFSKSRSFYSGHLSSQPGQGILCQSKGSKRLRRYQKWIRGFGLYYSINRAVILRRFDADSVKSI